MGGGRVKNRQFFGQHSLQTAPQDKRHLSKSTEIPHGKKTLSFFILLNGSSGLYPHHHSLIQFLPHVLKKRDVKKKTRQGFFQGHQKKQLVQSLTHPPKQLFVPSVGEGCLRTIYSATTFLEKCRKVVQEKWFCKLRIFFLVNHFS